MLDGGVQALDGEAVLASDVDVALLRADGEAGNSHGFQHAVGIAFKDAAVHERARIALVGVADYELALRDLLGDEIPLETSSTSREG